MVKTIPLPATGNITTSEFKATTRKGYPITQGFDENLQSFVMVSAVPFKICQMVQSVIGDNTSLALTINPESESKACVEGEENILVFGEGVGSAANGTNNNGQEETPPEEHPCSTDADCLPYAPDTPVCSTGGTCVACADKDITTPVWDADFSTCTACPTWEATIWTDIPGNFTQSNKTGKSCTLTDSNSKKYTVQTNSTLQNSTSFGICHIFDNNGNYYPAQSTAQITVNAVDHQMRLRSIFVKNGGSGANRYYTSVSVAVSEDGSNWTNIGTQQICSSKTTCIDKFATFKLDNTTPYQSLRVNLVGNASGSLSTPAVMRMYMYRQVMTSEVRSERWDFDTKTCVQCVQNSDCADTTTPVCNTSTHTCIAN